MVELADTGDLKSPAERYTGSSPVLPIYLHLIETGGGLIEIRKNILHLCVKILFYPTT